MMKPASNKSHPLPLTVQLPEVVHGGVDARPDALQDLCRVLLDPPRPGRGRGHGLLVVGDQLGGGGAEHQESGARQALVDGPHQRPKVPGELRGGGQAALGGLGGSHRQHGPRIG